jgi:hypothetical protein
MKKRNRKLNKHKVSELAEQFQEELDRKLPVTVLPNGGIVYKNYLIKQSDTKRWDLYDYRNGTLIESFFLKTCALMAAKAYYSTHLERLVEVKRIDSGYWASYTDRLVFQHNIKTAKEFERYLILLNRLEESQLREQQYKAQISRMFKWSFV